MTAEFGLRVTARARRHIRQAAELWELNRPLAPGAVKQELGEAFREAARRVWRDVKAVHGDVTALLNAGVLSRAADGRVVFPFEAVKVEFELQAA